MSAQATAAGVHWWNRQLGDGNGGRPGFREEFWKLVYAVERYRRRPAPNGERIAVGLSILCYGAACWRLADGGHLAEGVALLLLTICFWGMAGFYAEEDPPEGGKAELIRAITSYTPMDRAAYETLLVKMTDGGWAIRDLAAFMKAEAAANLDAASCCADAAACNQGVPGGAAR